MRTNILLGAAILSTALTASASTAIHNNLVTDEDLIVGSIDNVSATAMKLTSKDLLIGGADEIQIPMEIPAYGTGVYKIKMDPNTQMRLTYQNENGQGCRITFVAEEGFYIDHDIDKISQHTSCQQDWDTNNFRIDAW